MNGPFQIIAWSRGNYGVRDTRFPIGDQRRIYGRGFTRKREAEQYVRDINRRFAAMTARISAEQVTIEDMFR